MPQSVVSRQLANPFLAPDFSAAPARRSASGRLASWELLGPLFRSFEQGGASSCMDLPEPSSLRAAHGLELMHHQGQVISAAASGHRTFLLADEPGLGKTAQALLAAQAADAYPLLAVVPNVVKTNWAREAELWTPGHPATVIHGDGHTIDGFADIVVVNYEVLDRHVGWLGDFGFRGMVVDEAHFIKNKTSQRSQHVLQLSDRIRARTVNPLLMALTGTPLINDIEDFRAIWQFLGWIDDKKPRATLMAALEETGLTPADPGFYAAARASVIDLGIVRRRKVDVAADIPARRIADLPVELDDEAGRSIRAAEQELARRLVSRYETALATRTSGAVVEGIDHGLVRQVAKWEREDATSKTEENVFGVMRRIGQAKAGLAADYAAQLARSVGKVVFFAKHIDVMDAAEETFAKRGIRYSSIRGEQSRKAREANIDAFVNDPDVAVVVCSLTAAGVGLNLQVASNVVLAELSWTDAEQTQAIDRVHRIGQGDPVTAWRIIAAQTIDSKVAQLIDSKAGLAARALDGSDEEVSSSADVQLEALGGAADRGAHRTAARLSVDRSPSFRVRTAVLARKLGLRLTGRPCPWGMPRAQLGGDPRVRRGRPRTGRSGVGSPCGAPAPASAARGALPSSEPCGQGAGADAVGEHAEEDRQGDDRHRLVRARSELLQGEQREDQGRQPPRPEPADEQHRLAIEP